jgi:hypothetical protein
VRELLRYVRIMDARDPSYATPWPGHPPTEKCGRVPPVIGRHPF